MSAVVEVRYSKELTDEERHIYDAGRRAEAKSIGEWAAGRLSRLTAEWVRDGGPSSQNAQGFAGHTRGLNDTSIECERRARSIA